MDNIFALHLELIDKIYRHGGYYAFKVNDPKPRDIHKASVRDRLLHHAIYRMLYPFFDRKFIYDSYSCRLGKGTHRAINRFRDYGRKVSKNYAKTVWVLKCDIRKFFASIDHRILKEILQNSIVDDDALWLLSQVIDSYNESGKLGVGLPLGNLTSQLLVNIYMNEFDQFVKRRLKVRHYIRYADDFVILHEDKKYLDDLLPEISGFLETQLKLTLHPNKVSITTLGSGVDYLGWVHFPHYRVLRTVTRRRMLDRINLNSSEQTMQSYFGLISHGDTYKLRQEIKSLCME